MSGCACGMQHHCPWNCLPYQQSNWRGYCNLRLSRTPKCIIITVWVEHKWNFFSFLMSHCLVSCVLNRCLVFLNCLWRSEAAHLQVPTMEYDIYKLLKNCCFNLKYIGNIGSVRILLSIVWPEKPLTNCDAFRITMFLMTWVYWYYWPLPLLKYRKRPSIHVCNVAFVVFFGIRCAFCVYLFNGKRCNPFCHFCLLADDKFLNFQLSPLLTNRKNGYGAGVNPYSHFFSIYISKWIKNMKLWWDAILQKQSCPYPRPYHGDTEFISPAWLTNQITGLAKMV